jgi:hypothetical protein
VKRKTEQELTDVTENEERLRAVEKRERSAEKGELETNERRLTKIERTLTKIKRRLSKVRLIHEKLGIEYEAKALVLQGVQVDEMMQKCGDDEANGKGVDHQDLVCVARYFIAYRKIKVKEAVVDTALQQLSAEADAEAGAFFNNYKYK